MDLLLQAGMSRENYAAIASKIIPNVKFSGIFFKSHLSEAKGVVGAEDLSIHLMLTVHLQICLMSLMHQICIQKRL